MKILGHIAIWEGNFPVTDSQGCVVLFPTMEEAMDRSESLSYRKIVATYPVVKASKK